MSLRSSTSTPQVFYKLDHPGWANGRSQVTETSRSTHPGAAALGRPNFAALPMPSHVPSMCRHVHAGRD